MASADGAPWWWHLSCRLDTPSGKCLRDPMRAVPSSRAAVGASGDSVAQRRLLGVDGDDIEEFVAIAWHTQEGRQIGARTIFRRLHPDTVPDASRVATRKPFRVQRGALVIVGRDNVRRVSGVARIVRIPMRCMRCSLRKRLNGRNCGFTLTILSLIQTRNDAAERTNLALWESFRRSGLAAWAKSRRLFKNE